MGVRAFIAMILALSPLGLVACGSSHGSPAATADGGAELGDGFGGGAPDGPSSTTVDDGGLTSACDDYFAAAVACSFLPNATAAHDAPRFLQVCLIQASLPGSTTTASTYEACAQTKKADCSAECQFPLTGTLAAGAPCNPGFDYQCQSGACVQVRLPDGGYPACGICATSIPVAQPCSSSDDTATNCVPGSYCAGPTSNTCVAYGTVGAACSQGSQCQSDLFCSSSHQCVAQGALGAACSVDPEQTECAAELPCVAGVCAKQAAAGEPCTPSGWAAPCEFGLTCDTNTLTCVAQTVQPGGVCGANGLLCVLGSCSKTGICPTIIPDGQPCPVDDTETCDAFADCDDTGRCAIPGSPVCM
jgi:hypothetical protein